MISDLKIILTELVNNPSLPCYGLMENVGSGNASTVAVFPLSRFFSANRRFVGARASNFWL